MEGEPLNDAFLSLKSLWNAVVYGVCCYLLGLTPLKAIALAVVALTCVALNYGGRWVLRAGFGLLVLTTLVWLGVVPSVGRWHELIAAAAGKAGWHVA